MAKVKDDIEYSNHLVKIHNVMNVLDLPNNQEEAFRDSLTKHDNKTLEDLAKKSKKDIIVFLTEQNNENNKLKTERIEEKSSKIDSKSNENDIRRDQKETKLNQDIQKIKSVFTPQILEKNSNIAWNFKSIEKIDKEISNETDDTKKAELIDEKDEVLKGILKALKNDNGKLLKSITDQLWWADKNNPQYLEFKNALLGVDSGFEKYFQDLEKISSWNSLNANEVISWIEKDSWWIIELDLNSNTPISKMSLIWSQYSFDEEIDKKALAEVMGEGEKELIEVQNSEAVLKGLYKPFD